MYESHWQLDERPFDNQAVERFYYPCESHQGALLKLRYVVENRRGGALLTGESGLGKTLLVHALQQQLPESVTPRVHLTFPQMPPDQLLAYLAGELGATAADTESVQQSHRFIARTLAENCREGRHALVVIDEAHLLDEAGALETVRLLLNLETEGQPNLTLLLAGQTTLLPVIDRHPQLEERLGVKCLLRPLTEDETVAYIQHRLSVAGSTQPIFDDDGLATIYRLSLGIPRRINRLADLALLIGYAEEQTQLSAAHIEAVANELIAVGSE
jgi:type II secretory pathway predicted ATPase ExeA